MALDFSFVDPIKPEEIPDPNKDIQVSGPELEQRKAGWREALSQWNNPNMRQAIMQTGIGLMRSPNYGESGWDVAANALTSGVGTLEKLNERDRQRKMQQEAIARAQAQQAVENARGDRQVAATEKNAATQEKSVTGQIAANQASGMRLDTQLTETERHNRAEEENARNKTANDAKRATAYAAGRAGKTAAEIEKINRLQKYYMDKEGLDEATADKKAIDFVTTSNNKTQSQVAADLYKNKLTLWSQNFDNIGKAPSAKELKAMKEEAMMESGEFFRTENTTGPIKRPEIPGAAPTAATPQANPQTQQKIQKWLSMKATPEQIKIMIAAGSEDPKLYGY